MHRLPALISVLALSACASAPPGWIGAPAAAVEGGLAATACVPDSGKLAADRQNALALAGADLSRQMLERAAAMEQAYAQFGASVAEGTQPFDAAAVPVVESLVGGLAPARVEYVDVADVQKLCALLAVDAAQTLAAYEAIVRGSARTLDGPQNTALYRIFSASR